MSGSVDFNHGWREGQKALREELLSDEFLLAAYFPHGPSVARNDPELLEMVRGNMLRALENVAPSSRDQEPS